jgi:hypothetical protein
MWFNHYSLLGDGYYSQAAQSIVWPLTWVRATNYLMTTVPSNFYYPKRKWGPNCASLNTTGIMQFNDRLGSDNSLYLIHILSTDPKEIKCCKFYIQQMTSDCKKLYSRVTDCLYLVTLTVVTVWTPVGLFAYLDTTQLTTFGIIIAGLNARRKNILPKVTWI